MKLYNVNLSNYASKCRIAIYEKACPVEIAAIPGGDLKSAEYLKIYPMGKTPALDADGVIIGESEIINEYLEEKFPTPALLPKSPEARARVRGFTRFHDLFLEPPGRAMFGQLDPKTRDAKLVAEKLAEVNTRLDQLEKMLSDGAFAAGPEFTLADCALAPTMFFFSSLLPIVGAKPVVEGRPKLARWWANAQERPSVKKVIGEMSAALAERMQQQSR